MPLLRQVAPDTLELAQGLTGLANVAFWQANHAAAYTHLLEILRIRERVAPDSILVARSLQNLGRVDLERANLKAARGYLTRAIPLWEKVAPDSPELATSLTTLGLVDFREGNLTGAEALYRRGLAIRERVVPESMDVAASYLVLAHVAATKGQHQVARDSYLRALRIQERVGPNSGDVAATLQSLGTLSRIEGDLEAARSYYERSIAIWQKLAPQSLFAARSLAAFGHVAIDLKDVEAGRKALEAALAVFLKAAPDSLDVADTLDTLGTVAGEAGDLAAATGYFERAVALRRRVGSPDAAGSLSHLAEVASRRGDRAAAKLYAEEALAIWETARPGTLWAAEGHHAVAKYGFDDLPRAFDHASRAWAIVKRQAIGITGEDARQAFTGQYAAIGALLATIQGMRGDADGAFVTVEEGRAQSLLQLLAERDMATSLVGPELMQRYQRAREAAARDAQTESRIEAERLWGEVRNAVAPLAPPVENLAAARRAIPERSILVEFAVRDAGVLVFLVRPTGPVQAIPVPIDAKALTARVNQVRPAASREPQTRGLAAAGTGDISIRAARELFQKLFPPAVRQAIHSADRVILSPDGPLWDLPFAALVTNESGTPQYLGLQKPLVYTQSLTTLAQTVARRQPGPAKLSAMVVGNPLFDSAQRGTRASGELAMLSGDGGTPAPLPYAEEEARRVAGLYATAAAVSGTPTEAWFRERSATADVIHLATHAYFNPQRAVSSGLHLAVPERAPEPGQTNDDGALQAWEVLTQIKLRARLVVLSACETGLGAKVPGEGLIGLTRAFQVAGAGTVVATQWKVVDRSTATAMVAFHQHLQKGLPRDVALWQAMRAVARNPATAHPYHWAPFVLVGDMQPLGATR